MTGKAVKTDAGNRLHGEGQQLDLDLIYGKEYAQCVHGCKSLQDPETILRELSRQAYKENFKFGRLYRILYNPDMYLLAFQNIYANKGALTMGTSDVTISGFGDERIERIIKSLRDRTYQPHPARRILIPKKNSTKMRPLGISEGNDKIVQEIVKMILEAIYEPEFSASSHGFRPGRSCHTALQQIQQQFRGSEWFLEGDIVGCFNNFDHATLIKILRKRITDESFIQLIWKFLKAGYMENWVYVDTYSGVPQGSGCSPVLCNIYLNELDNYIQDYIKKVASPQAKYPVNPTYGVLSNKLRRIPDVQWNNMSIAQRKEKIKQDHILANERRKMSSTRKSRTGIISISYVRYADDFLLAINGSKEDVRKLKGELKNFLDKELHLQLSEEKTLITHATERAKFLGYEISIARDNNVKMTKRGPRRVYNGEVRLYMPRNTVRDKLLKYDVLQINTDGGGREIWRPMPRLDLAYLSPHVIMSTYNAEIRGLYNYYRMACNVCSLNSFGYMMKRSCQKTLGAKYRTRFVNIESQFMINGIMVATYRNKKGELKKVEFYHEGFKHQKVPLKVVQDLPFEYSRGWRREITYRMQAHTCELCGVPSKEIKVHLVRKVKDLGNEWLWEQTMKEIRRKTLIVCPACYDAINNGSSPRAVV